VKFKLLRQIGSIAVPVLAPVKHGAAWAYALQVRERQRLQSEMAQIGGLLPLLMKQRNGERWSAEDKRALREKMAKLADLSPYLVLFVAPGGFFALPALAWWLDRRRQKRIGGPHQPAVK
jgi:hypothetical protein